MSVVFSYLPALVVGILLLCLLVLLRLIHAHFRNKNRNRPAAVSAFRFPGQTLRQRLNDLNQDAVYYTGNLVFVPFLICFIYTLQLHVETIRFTKANVVRIGLLAILISGFILIKTLKTLNQRRLIRQGYECELAVGQALDRLGNAGYHVFHDFPADDFNIDHVIVGSKGVFAVETKAFSGAPSASPPRTGTVEYNGHVLFFSGGKDLKTIERARIQAAWLSEWLGSAVGEPIATRAIVALPGWTVKRTSADGIPVINPIQFPTLLEHIQPRHLTDEKINRIVDRFEQKCGAIRLRAGKMQSQS